MCCDCGKYRQSLLEIGERRKRKESWRWNKEIFGSSWMEIDRRTSNGECMEEWGVGRGSIEHWSKIDGTSIDDLSKINRTFIAGMGLLTCKVNSAGCFLGGVCGSLSNAR